VEEIRDAGAHGAALLAQLRRAPAKTKDLAAAIGVSRHTASAVLTAMSEKGLVHCTGATASLRWHLGAASTRQPEKPAKEEP